MCFKVYLSAALFFACFLFSEGFFLPVFVRKQAPQTPAVNNAQWAPPQPLTAGTGSVQVPFKEYNPYQHQHQHQAQAPSPSQQQSHMTSLQPVQMTPLQPINPTQYSYDSPVSMALPYSQMQAEFHSVKLVPCLCPISKDVIDRETQQMQHAAAPPPPAQPHTVESGSNSVMVQGSHKISS